MREKGAYEPALDGLRATACLGVVFFHCRVPGFSGGGIGVDVFFVLSGYLITGLLATEIEDAGEVNVWRFLVRRALRLWPALIAMLAVYAALAPLAFPYYGAARWRDVFAASVYLTDYTRMFGWPTPLAHTWSLAVEAQFYLLWPLVLTLLLKAPRQVAAVALIAAWAALTLGRGVAMQEAADWNAVYHPLHWRMTGLILGSALALAPVRWGAAWIGWLGAALLLTLCALLPSEAGVPLVRWGIPLAELASVGLLISILAGGSLRRGLAWPPLVAIGLMSYGLYLWHAPIAWFMWSSPWWLLAPTVLGASLPLAWLSYRFLETRRAGREPTNALSRSP